MLTTLYALPGRIEHTATGFSVRCLVCTTWVQQLAVAAPTRSAQILLRTHLADDHPGTAL